MRAPRPFSTRFALPLAALLTFARAVSGQVTGEVRVEGQLFGDRSREPAGDLFQGAIDLSGDFRTDWDTGRQSLVVESFLRLDPTGKRTRFDLAEVRWGLSGEAWDLRIGTRQLFWGVAESQAVVDVVNQRDLGVRRARDLKLGQPMLELASRHSWGRLQFLVMPLFRTRGFESRGGELWSSTPVSTSEAVFESGRGRGHVDLALRWEHSLGAWDIGAGYFRGTSREPGFVSDVDADGNAIWIPRYDLVDVFVLDALGTAGVWVWKIEGSTRNPAEGRYVAAVGGLEYAPTDYLAVFAEYLLDTRGTSATTSFASDVFVGSRLFLPDGSLEFGAIIDHRTASTVLSAELRHRLGDSVLLGIEAGAFLGDAAREPELARRQHRFVSLSTFLFFF